MSNNNNFLALPDQKDLFVPVRNGGSTEKPSNSPVDDEDDEPEDDIRLIPRCSPVPRKRGPSIADETAEYMRIRLALKRRVSFADATGGDLVDVREFVAFDSDDEDKDRWEAEEARYRAAVREPTYHLHPEFQGLSGDELMRSLNAGKVEVERISIDPDEPLAFSGIIRVLNISFHKSVYVRSTMDGWGTYFDYPADYVEGSFDGNSDQFSFKLSFAQPYLFNGARIDFVVKYATSDGEFWANNSGKNYSVTLLVTFEDPVAQGVDMSNLRGILKPPRPELDYASSEDEDEGASGGLVHAPVPMRPVVVQPEMDIDVGVQEQESLSISSKDRLELTTSEDTPGFSTAMEITPTPPAFETFADDQQDTITKASTSLPLSEPHLEQLGSEINISSPPPPPPPPPPPQQLTEPVVQEVVKDATSIPESNVSLPGLPEDTITEDKVGLMPPLETRVIEPKMSVDSDVPPQLGFPELATPAPCLPLNQEMDDYKDRDRRVTPAEEMERFAYIDEIEEELTGIKEEIETIEGFDGSERSAIKELESTVDLQIDKECRRNDRSVVADLEGVPQVNLGFPSSMDESSSATEVPEEDPELHPREESSQAAGEDVSLPVASHSLPTHQSSIHPGPTGEDNMTQSPLLLSDYISYTDKSPAPLDDLKPCQALALEESFDIIESKSDNHIPLAVTSDSQPSESKRNAEDVASMQYLTIDAHTTIPSTRNTSYVPEDSLEVSAHTEELKPPAEVSCPTCTSTLAPEVPKGPPELLGDSGGTLDRPISIWNTLKPAMYGLSTVLCLTAAMQEYSLFFVLGLYLVVNCF